MRATIYILLVFLFFSGCRTTQKETSRAHQTEQTRTSNDITLTDDKHLAEIVSNAIKTAINERLNIALKQTKYDTDKPIDPETGKPPILEENNVVLTKETETKQTDNTFIQKDSAESTQLTDNTQAETRTQTDIQTKATKETKSSRDLLLPAACLVLLVAGGIWYVKTKL